MTFQIGRMHEAGRSKRRKILRFQLIPAFRQYIRGRMKAPPAAGFFHRTVQNFQRTETNAGTLSGCSASRGRASSVFGNPAGSLLRMIFPALAASAAKR